MVYYFSVMNTQNLRNIAIIAHVDHGKTTLVDALLKQSNTFRDADAAGTTIMDSNELERERGITIFSKNASIEWKGKKIIKTHKHAEDCPGNHSSRIYLLLYIIFYNYYLFFVT